MNALAGRLRLDFRADEPIVLQIVRQIEALVAEGTLKPGEQLPTVRELAIDLRINFSTVARAYRILDEQRLISTQRGRGTYIWEEATAEQVQQEAARQEAARQEAALQEMENLIKEGRISNEMLSGMAQRFIREAVESGASAEQIEQAFRQTMDGWKRDHPNHLEKQSGG